VYFGQEQLQMFICVVHIESCARRTVVAGIVTELLGILSLINPFAWLQGLVCMKE